MKAVSCPSCWAKMKRNGKTSADTQKWRCGSCGTLTTLSYDDAVARLGEFLTWLLTKEAQAAIPGRGRMFRRLAADFRPIWNSRSMPWRSAGRARWVGGGPGAAGVELIEDAYEARILHAGEAWGIKQSRDQRFSFVALSPEAVVSEAGMRLNLDRKHVELLGDLGISNVIDESEATITCHEGTIAAFLFDGYFAGA